MMDDVMSASDLADDQTIDVLACLDFRLAFTLKSDASNRARPNVRLTITYDQIVPPHSSGPKKVRRRAKDELNIG